MATRHMDSPCLSDGIRSLFWLHQWRYQEYPRTDVAEDCPQRVPPDSPSKCRPAIEDRGSQRTPVQASYPSRIRHPVYTSDHRLRLRAYCSRSRSHQCHHHHPELSWQCRPHTRSGDRSYNVMVYLARLCQVDVCLPHARRSSRALYRTGHLHTRLLEGELNNSKDIFIHSLSLF